MVPANDSPKKEATDDNPRLRHTTVAQWGRVTKVLDALQAAAALAARFYLAQVFFLPGLNKLRD